MFQRNISQAVLDALSDTPVVFIRGARQTGKSTFVQSLAKGAYPARYVTLDNAAVLSAAAADPSGFIANIEKPVIIDEVQRVPDLLLAIKEDVDQDRRPGKYLLTGSANILTMPRVSDSLAGRMEILTLWPLSQGEIKGIKDNFIDVLFGPRLKGYGPLGTDIADIAGRIVAGGYPEPLSRPRSKRRAAWFDSYVTSCIERDVRDISNVQDLSAMPRLLRLLAARTAALANRLEISRSIGIPNATLVRYMTLIEGVFLLHRLPAWAANLGKRPVKSPKLFLVDTGLACSLLGLEKARLQDDHDLAGRLFESFVLSEFLKQASWSRTRVKLYHFRSHTGQEVDIILEDDAGNVCGVEVKFSATVKAKHFNGLKLLQESLGNKFQKGIVLYAGKEFVPFGDELFAVPVSVLWETNRGS